MLRRIDAEAAMRVSRPAVDGETLSAAGEIVDAVRDEGEAAVRRYAERFGERRAGESLVLGREAMADALSGMDVEDRAALARAADRIRAFARAQRDAIGEVCVPIPGGEAGHTIEPVSSAGCYAPGGRYPLPSSVLMTAVTAREAGCERVVVASPGADPVMLAAAGIAGADAFLATGGAHGIGALAYGFGGFAPCDVVVGPGNRWVTAAKQLVSGVVGIDMLAGPSELLVIADETADARLVAADLLAQAEHDEDACAMLVTTSSSLADAVDGELARQLDALATRATARVALGNGFSCVTDSMDSCVSVADRAAAEHVQVMTRDAEVVARRVRHAGGVFVGSLSAEVVGDYGAGPNHTLPTGGSARYRAGLSVMNFLRLRTWIRLDDASAASDLLSDSGRLASLEGLRGHERAARMRLGEGLEFS